MGCITGARYTMRATILHSINPAGSLIDPLSTGSWVDQQDTLTGEIVRVWSPVPVDASNTPSVDESLTVNDIWCMARGIVDGGIRAAATTEHFDDIYHNVDIIHLWVPGSVKITKRDRITNIRDRDGNITWRDEEHEGSGEVKATVFNVNGVIPTFDFRNVVISNFCLLERVEV